MSLDYMERIVNDGSKSGFTNINTTSKTTNPFYSNGFYVLKYTSDSNCFESYGNLEKYDFQEKNNNCIYLHPDWSEKPEFSNIFSFGEVEKSYWVVPTSSARTVHIYNSNTYLKLYYPGIIGRLNRELKFPQLISGIEITKIFESAKKNHNLLPVFAFMPEPYGRILKKDKNEIGFLIREFPIDICDMYLIPGFSMFSKDQLSPEDTSIIFQLLYSQDNPIDYLLTQFCYPLIDIFFMCVLNEGLIPEMHSQNILFAFDKNWDVKRIILRDFESIDKDISIREELGKCIDFLEFPYKCISSSDSNYRKRYSFMYDHKLCEYLLDPLIQSATIYLNINSDIIKKKIKDYTHSNYSNILSKLFPEDGCWYKYPDSLIDRTTKERPYMSMGESIYR